MIEKAKEHNFGLTFPVQKRIILNESDDVGIKSKYEFTESKGC